MTPKLASELIDLLGGTTAVARRLNIKPPSVHEWRSSGIPEDRLARLAPAIEIASSGRHSRRSLFPRDWHERWPELAAQHASRAARQQRARKPGRAHG